MNNMYAKRNEQDNMEVVTIIVIGNDALKTSETIFKRFMFYPTKIKESKYGNMNSYIYKLTFSERGNMEIAMKSIKHMVQVEYDNKVTYLRKSLKCIILMNKIKF